AINKEPNESLNEVITEDSINQKLIFDMDSSDDELDALLKIMLGMHLFELHEKFPE
ncbi:11264_t:CDS:1, partial [Cetraspora pellucida]